MIEKEKKEIYRLVKLKDYKFNYELLKSLNQQSDIRSYRKRNINQQNLKIITNNYEMKLNPFTTNIKERVCSIYCMTRIFTHDEIDNLSELIVDVVSEMAIQITIDPLLISFIIRKILKKICQCGRNKSNIIYKVNCLNYKLNRTFKRI